MKYQVPEGDPADTGLLINVYTQKKKIANVYRR